MDLEVRFHFLPLELIWERVAVQVPPGVFQQWQACLRPHHRPCVASCVVTGRVGSLAGPGSHFLPVSDGGSVGVLSGNVMMLEETRAPNPSGKEHQSSLGRGKTSLPLGERAFVELSTPACTPGRERVLNVTS